MKDLTLRTRRVIITPKHVSWTSSFFAFGTVECADLSRFAKSVGRVTSEAVDGTSPAPNAKSILSFTGLQTGSHVTWTHPKRITLSSIPGGTEFLPHFDWKTMWCPNSTIAKHLQGAFDFFCNQVPDVLVPPANLIQSKLLDFYQHLPAKHSNIEAATSCLFQHSHLFVGQHSPGSIWF